MGNGICGECGAKASDGFTLYCVPCAERFIGPSSILLDALQQIATGCITGGETNYQDTVSVMRSIASKAIIQFNESERQ